MRGCVKIVYGIYKCKQMNLKNIYIDDYENFKMSDSEPNDSIDKQTKNVKKRRSMILQRRSICRLKGNETIPPYVDDSGSTSDTQESFDLQQHIKNLQDEYRMWKELLKERKLQSSRLRKELETVKETGQEFDINQLTDTQQAWLAEQTDYKQFLQNAEKLTKLAIKSITLRQHLDKLNDSLITSLNQEIAKTSKRIIALVD